MKTISKEMALLSITIILIFQSDRNKDSETL